MPSGDRRLDLRWRYRTKEGDAALAVDGRTCVPRGLFRAHSKGTSSLRWFSIVPSQSPASYCGVGRDSMFPTRFRIGAQDLAGTMGRGRTLVTMLMHSSYSTRCSTLATTRRSAAIWALCEVSRA